MSASPPTAQVFARPRRLQGEIRLPGDKSISHRALLFAALAPGRSELRGLGTGGDVRATAAALRALGLDVALDGDRAVVQGQPLAAWRSPAAALDCGNSGTTLRLLCGLLAAADGLLATLTGDDSLRRRPTARVVEPLRRMGAELHDTAGRPPVRVVGQRLHGARHVLPVASAQVKTALLLAGLHADGQTEVGEPVATRDHTERLLAALGAPIEVEGTRSRIHAGPLRPPGLLQVPGDPSSAAFLVVAALLHPAARVVLPALCCNPTRLGFVRVLQRMGAEVAVDVTAETCGEPVGTLIAASSALRAVDVTPDEVPACIDELPILALAAACATGRSVLRGIGELRVKESDRLTETARLLAILGVPVEAGADVLAIEGLGSGSALRGGRYLAGLDHRMAMTAAVAGLVGGGAVTVDGAEAVVSSFPGFAAAVAALSA